MNSNNKSKNVKIITKLLLSIKNKANKEYLTYFNHKNKINKNFMERKRKYFIIKKIFIHIFILKNIIFPIISKNIIYNKRILEEGYEIIEIILNVTDDGEISISNKDFQYKPTYVEVNQTIMNISDNYTITLYSNIYLIKLKWDYQLKTLQNLFSGISNIIEVDFSNFTTSNVNLMKNMLKDYINSKE